MITEALLQQQLGKHISEICDVGFHGDEENHCAHFVCHILGDSQGYNCRNQHGGKTGSAAGIRVHELFSRCVQVGPMDTFPMPLLWSLIFITNPRNVNVKNKTMVNVPKKHVGFFFNIGQTVYHYSNSRRQVVQQTLADFGNHYASPHNALFWGTKF